MSHESPVKDVKCFKTSVLKGHREGFLVCPEPLITLFNKLAI